MVVELLLNIGPERLCPVVAAVLFPDCYAGCAHFPRVLLAIVVGIVFMSRVGQSFFG
jgi:hypothetical protein